MSATKRPRRDKDTEEVIAGIRRQMRSLEARAEHEDSWVVDDMLALRDELDAMAVRTVARMRAQGVTWRDIGGSLGLNAIQTHKKFAHKIEAAAS